MASSKTTQAHVLVVDDDERIRRMLTRFLEEQGFDVSSAEDGQQMWKHFNGRRIDMVLLDLNLPGGEDGLDLAREIRLQSDVPIMMLTSRDDVIDRVVGIELGADDYIAKPFNLREVLARLKALLRRCRLPATLPVPVKDEVLEFNGWTFDLSRRTLRTPLDEPVELTTAEHDMLMILARNPGRVLTRAFLMEETRARQLNAFDRSIDSQIARLRKKVEEDSKHPLLIKSVRGVGYVFAAATSHDGISPDARRS